MYDVYYYYSNDHHSFNKKIKYIAWNEYGWFDFFESVKQIKDFIKKIEQEYDVKIKLIKAG